MSIFLTMSTRTSATLILSKGLKHDVLDGAGSSCQWMQDSARAYEPSEPSNSGLSRSNRKEGKPTDVDRRGDRVALVTYKIVIGILVISLIMAGLLFFQQANMLQLQNQQLSSRSSDLTQSLSDLNKIVNMQQVQLLKDNITILVSTGGVSLNLTCPCFKYSGYLHVSWRSSAHIMLCVVQFGLNLTTPNVSVGDFRVPVSSVDPFVASFVATGCPIGEQCTAIYSAVFRY